MQNVGSVPAGCYGYGEILPVLSCNYGPNAFDLIQYVGGGEKLVGAVLIVSPCVVLIYKSDSLFGPIGCVRLEVFSHAEGSLPSPPS